jgi:uncharacterized membrane protein YraQ (UPF0718 family)
MSLEILNSFFALVFGILLASWDIFVEAAPYLIFGFGIAGILNILIPDKKILEKLGNDAGKIRSVINAALAGLPLPLCSCGVIPAAMSIRKRGANKGATLSFLISTPETGVDSIAITYALLDPIMTIFRPLATLTTAILTGIAENFLIGEKEGNKEGTKTMVSEKKVGILTLSTFIGTSAQNNLCTSSACSCAGSSSGSFENKTAVDLSRESRIESVKTTSTTQTAISPLNLTEKTAESVRIRSQKNAALKIDTNSTSCNSCGCGCKDESPQNNLEKGKTLRVRLLEGIKYAYIDLPGHISKWMLIGILFAGIISYLVPETLIQNYLGGGLMSMFFMLLVGIPLYICATASTPLAASLIAKGMSPGTAFVFLLAGPATNIATITMVARFLGRRSAALYVGAISLCSLAAGVTLDWFYLKFGVNAVASFGTAKELLPENLQIAFALLLLPLMLYGTFCKQDNCSC